MEAHPESDLNGDGQIDEEEARTLARRLQEKHPGN